MTDERKEPVFKLYTKEELKLKRILLGYTVLEIASMCGLTRQTIQNIESGRREKPSTLYLVGVCLERLADRCDDESIKKALEKLDLV